MISMNKTCLINACPNKYLAKGYCSTHYKRYIYLPRRPLYHTWQSMIARCEKEWSQSWEYYGGRGIKVCNRWLDYTNFEADMSPKPAGLTLERKDNERGYSPDNCKWATPLEQRHNQRKQKMRRDNSSGWTNIRQLKSGKWELRGTNGVSFGTFESPSLAVAAKSAQWYAENLTESNQE